MTPRYIELGNLLVDRERTVAPRKRRYIHRDIITVVDDLGRLEDGTPVHNLPLFASTCDPYLWVTTEPARLLMIMKSAFDHVDGFNYQILQSDEVYEDGTPCMSYTRLTRFGITDVPGRRKQAMHLVWSPFDMMRNPMRVLEGAGWVDLLRFADDVRSWCREQNLPLPTSLSGISSGLLRDERFWPEARGRVPKATNENVRKYLPGVHSELRGRTNRRYHQAVALDQKTAYHRAAQEVPLPDPTTLYARGYFNCPEDAPIWATPGSVLYNRIVKQPGLLAVRAQSRPTGKREVRLPMLNFMSKRAETLYLWSSELELAQQSGLTIHGLVAAWTSDFADEGFPRYGKFAQGEIEAAGDYRKRWLKPILHATYGMLAARPRQLKVGHRHGKGRLTRYVLGRGYDFPVHEAELGAHSPPTTNVAALGVLQAEIRARSIKLADHLTKEGVEVLHIHADGIHVRGQLPLMPLEAWKVEPRTNLTYLDRVSWLAEEGDCLPGRDDFMRSALRRSADRVLTGRKRR